MTGEKVSRRGYVKYVGGIVTVAVIAATSYGIYEATKSPLTGPTLTPTPTPTPTPTLTPTPTPTPIPPSFLVSVVKGTSATSRRALWEFRCWREGISIHVQNA